jgi:hypothetical protein
MWVPHVRPTSVFYLFLAPLPLLPSMLSPGWGFIVVSQQHNGDKDIPNSKRVEQWILGERRGKLFAGIVNEMDHMRSSWRCSAKFHFAAVGDPSLSAPHPPSLEGRTWASPCAMTMGQISSTLMHRRQGAVLKRPLLPPSGVELECLPIRCHHGPCLCPMIDKWEERSCARRTDGVVALRACCSKLSCTALASCVGRESSTERDAERR